jgi:hypothetical protein
LLIYSAALKFFTKIKEIKGRELETLYETPRQPWQHKALSES